MFGWLFILIVVGVLALYKGADLLIDHASSLAAKFGVSTMVIGLSVVTIGGIMPELTIGVTSSFAGANDLIIGNALGSSILKLGLVLGIAALVAPISVKSSTLKHEFPWLMLASVLVYFLAFDLTISRGDAIILIVLGIAFQWYSVRTSQKDMLEELGKRKYEARQGQTMKSSRSWGKIILGLTLIIIGAKLFVDASLAFAIELNISELLVGIIIIAFGASIPELAVTVMSAARHEPAIGIGNIIGSNVMNIHLVAGIAALIHPLTIHPDLLIFDFPMFIFFTILVSVLFKSSHRLSRFEGALLLSGYALYFIYSIRFWS